MSDEINGGVAIVKKNGTEIVGQMDFTVAYNGTPIDISNKTLGDFVTLMDGQLAGKQLSLSGTIVYNNNTQYRAMRVAAIAGTQDTYTIEYVSGATVDEKFSALMVPTGMSDAVPHGDKISTSITLLSSATITHTPAS